MKLFVLFAPSFLLWPLAILERMRKDTPGLTLTGLTTGGRRVYETVTRRPISVGASVADLTELEHKWIKEAIKEQTRDEVLSVYSHQDLKRIIISDRNIGRRYVTGGTAAKTPLMIACEKDEIIERYVFNLCKWVIDLWESERFDSALCYAVAGAPAMAVALFCERKNISFLRFSNTRVRGGVILDSSPDGLFSPIRKKFDYYLQNPGKSDASVEFAEDFLEKFSRSPESPVYASRNRAKTVKKLSMSSLCKTLVADIYAIGRFRTRNEHSYLRQASGLSRIRYDLFTGVRGLRLSRRWPFETLKCVKGRKFIYFPLHVDPEASTSVLAPMFTDQAAIIEAISKAMPVDMKLVVKEHFPMLGRRPRGFYDRIRKLPGVALVSPHQNSFELILRSSLVCVITGTAAWEAIVLKRPALLFGSAPFSCVGEGFLQCSDMSMLPGQLRAALNLQAASRERIVAYIAALHSESLEFNFWGTSPHDLSEVERERLLDCIGYRILKMSSSNSAKAAVYGDAAG